MYVAVPGPLVYGGAWALLGGNNAARHLLLTIAALDPVRSEPAYKAEVMARAFARHGDDDPLAWLEDEAEAELAMSVARAKHPRSIRELAQLSGMQHASVLKALPPLLIHGVGLLVAGPPGGARWYGHHLQRVETYEPAELNAPGAMAELRAWRLEPSLPHNFQRLEEYRARLRSHRRTGA
jgi:hypothetical protein